MSDPITEAEYLGNNILAMEAARADRERIMATCPSRRESERREAAAQQAADLTLAAEATLRRATYLLERAEPLAETLGAALNHSGLNVANALGAYLGGLVVTAGYGYPATALVGVALALVGLLVLVPYRILDQRTGSPLR